MALAELPQMLLDELQTEGRDLTQDKYFTSLYIFTLPLLPLPGLRAMPDAFWHRCHDLIFAEHKEPSKPSLGKVWVSVGLLGS